MDTEKKVSKVVYKGDTIIDLSGDTITAETVKAGVTFHAPNGSLVEGTFDGVDTSDADAIAADVDEGKIVYVNGHKIEGTKKYQTKTVTENGTVTPDEGFGGLSKVEVNVQTPIVGNGVEDVETSTDMDSKLVPNNVGNLYRFIGVSDNKYENGNIYEVKEV